LTIPFTECNINTTAQTHNSSKTFEGENNMRDQNIRKSDGRYAEYERCELCNKKVFNNYCSDERCNNELQGRGVTLCDRCGIRLSEMNTESVLEALKNAETKLIKKGA
jgi:hypothetical protein